MDRKDPLFADSCLPHDAADCLARSMEGLHRFEQRLLGDTPPLHDALMVDPDLRKPQTLVLDDKLQTNSVLICARAFLAPPYLRQKRDRDGNPGQAKLAVHQVRAFQQPFGVM